MQWDPWSGGKPCRAGSRQLVLQKTPAAFTATRNQGLKAAHAPHISHHWASPTGFSTCRHQLSPFSLPSPSRSLPNRAGIRTGSYTGLCCRACESAASSAATAPTTGLLWDYPLPRPVTSCAPASPWPKSCHQRHTHARGGPWSQRSTPWQPGSPPLTAGPDLACTAGSPGARPSRRAPARPSPAPSQASLLYAHPRGRPQPSEGTLATRAPTATSAPSVLLALPPVYTPASSPHHYTAPEVSPVVRYPQATSAGHHRRPALTSGGPAQDPSGPHSPCRTPAVFAEDHTAVNATDPSILSQQDVIAPTDPESPQAPTCGVVVCTTRPQFTACSSMHPPWGVVLSTPKWVYKVLKRGLLLQMWKHLCKATGIVKN